MLMFVNVKGHWLRGLLGLLLLCGSLSGRAQLVDVNACKGNLLQCVAAEDTVYEMCFKVIPASICNYKKFTIDWGDNSAVETKTGSGTGDEIRHLYKLGSLDSKCQRGGVLKYTIKIETDCPGDNITRTLVFLVKPKIRLTIPDACEGKTVFFNNNTCPGSSDINNNITYQWTFGDGTTSTQASPTHVYSTSQTSYDVNLTATNQCGTDTRQQTVPIRKTPEANYTTNGYQFKIQDTTGVCLSNGGLLSLDATTSIDATRYSWTISPANYKYIGNTNSGSPVIKIQFTQSGIYTIMLTGLNDCGTSKPFPCTHKVVDLPVVNLTPQPDLCEAGKYTLRNPTPGASYSINGAAILPGQSVDVPVSNTPYIVTGSVSNQCGPRTVADTFMVQPPQAVQITLANKQPTVCAGSPRFALPVSLTGGSWSGSGAAFVQTGSSGAFFNPANVGQYSVIYTRGTAACSRSDTVRVLVEGGQTTVENLTVCNSTTFVKLQGQPAGGVWSSTTNPAAVRNDTLFLAGVTVNQLLLTYQVRFGATSGCPATATATVGIGQPKAAFTITGLCSNSAPQVQNQSTGGSAFDWMLNGRVVSSDRVPVFTLAPGPNRFQLTLRAGACSDVASQTLTVVAPPVAFSISPTFASDCSPMRVTLTPTGTASPDVQYAWDLGAGQRSAVFVPPVQTYLNQSRLPQPVSVSLTASNGCGRQVATAQFTVRPLAKAEIGVDSTLLRCTPARVKFANRSTGQSGSTWLFDDGSAALVSAADTLSHLFSARDSARTYRVRLVVASQCGRDTAQVAIRVIPTLVRPLMTISNATPCPGDVVTFTDATTPKPTRVIWRLADGQTQVTPVANWTFAQPNTTYTISLTALTECGFDSTRRSIRTTTLPTGSFVALPALACVGQGIHFTNATNPALRFRWTFGDGSPADSVTYSPDHSYAKPGTYSLSLSVFGGTSAGCRLVVPGQVSVRERPKAIIQLVGDSLQCRPGTLSLQAGAQSGNTAWQWRVSDGQQFTGATITVPLRESGTFDVSLTATSGIPGCVDSTRRTGILQVIDCEVQVPGAFTPNRDGIGDSWTLFGPGILSIKLLRVRSRWGEVVFEGENFPANSLRPGECWDGTFNGTPMPAGSYTYEAELLLRGNRADRRVGSVELRR